MRFYRLDFVSLPPHPARRRTLSRLQRKLIRTPEPVSKPVSILIFSPPTTHRSLILPVPLGIAVPLRYPSLLPSNADPCLFRASPHLSSPYSYFISVPSSALASSAIPPCSPVVGCADFFLGYRPVDRAAIRWTAIRIDYSLPKLRRGAFILYNSPAALVPSLLFPRFFLARYNRASLSSRARRQPCAHSCERKRTLASTAPRGLLKVQL